MFLDAPFTSRFKSLQLSEIARLFEEDIIQDGDIIFFSDIWFPGIESIAYMSHFTGKTVKIRGILHAGSFTDTDEVRQFERWAKNFEDVIFDIADKIYVGSDFIKQDVIRKRMIHPDKIEVTPLPLDVEGLNKYKLPRTDRYPNVIFNGRDHIEKQPWLFEQFKQSVLAEIDKHDITIPGLEFIWTQERNYTKDEYYDLLSKSSIVVSFALQENFGYGIAEAAYLGCIPIVPNRLVYPELYTQEALYDSIDTEVSHVLRILLEKPDINKYIKQTNMITTGNLDSIPRWFK
tara:strand:- start:11915 stop:12784 length:870 start_codon:yes stop_codon:yes gene_type:complete